MKRAYFVCFLLSFMFMLVACVGKTPPIPPTAGIAASSTAVIQSTETTVHPPTITPTSTAIPTETPPPTLTTVPTMTPDLDLMDWKEGGFLEPQSLPLTEWCGVPVMNAALAGDNIDIATYVYKTSSPPMDVYKYYLAEMPNLGWELYLAGTDAVNAVPAEMTDLDEFHPMLFYQKESFSEQSSIVLMQDSESGLIYVMIICGG